MVLQEIEGRGEVAKKGGGVSGAADGDRFRVDRVA